MDKAALVPNERLASPAIDEDEIDLKVYWHIFNRYKWKILFLTMVIGLLATLVSFSLEPIYRSTTLLLIESNQAKVISIEEVYGINSANKEYYQTQIGILKSRGLAEKVVKKLNLLSHPLYLPKKEDEGFSFNLKDWMPSSWSSASEEAPPSYQEQFDTVVKAVMEAISIKPVRNSQLVEISFESPDANLAAKVPNTLSDIYIESDLDAKLKQTEKARSWLNKRIAKLRNKLRQAERRQEDYMERNGLVNVEGIKSVAVKKIEQTVEHLVNARQRLTEATSTYRQVQALKGRPIQAFESIPAVLNNRLVQTLKEAELDAERKVSELAERYGQKHPKIIAAQAELRTAKRNTAQQIRQVVAAITKEYEVAVANVKALKQNVALNERIIQELNKKGIELARLTREVERNRRVYEIFLTRLKETTASKDVQALQSTVGRVVDSAVVSIKPYKPKKKLIIAISLVLGFLFATMLAFFLEYLDNTIKDADDVEDKLGFPLLGSLPRLKLSLKGENKEFEPRWMFLNEQKSGFAEEVRTIRTGIMLSLLDNSRKVLVVTSSVPGEGKSTVSINQAFALGQMEKTLLIEADMRRPTLVKTFGLNSKAPGLAELVAGTGTIEECIHSIGAEGGVDVIPSGKVPANPLELLASPRFIEIVEKLSKQYGYVVIDSAPTLLVSDAMVLAKLADQVLYVVKADHTPYPIVQDGLKRLQKINAPIPNIILNQVPTVKKGKYYYGKYNKYGYYRKGYAQYGYGGDHSYYS
jgi:capsular exopolysaccharide synthesis family protein